MYIFILTCCGVRVVKEMDSKSIGLCPHRFESCPQRQYFYAPLLDKAPWWCREGLCVIYTSRNTSYMLQTNTRGNNTGDSSTKWCHVMRLRHVGNASDSGVLMRHFLSAVPCVFILLFFFFLTSLVRITSLINTKCPCWKRSLTNGGNSYLRYYYWDTWCARHGHAVCVCVCVFVCVCVLLLCKGCCVWLSEVVYEHISCDYIQIISIK